MFKSIKKFFKKIFFKKNKNLKFQLTGIENELNLIESQLTGLQKKYIVLKQQIDYQNLFFNQFILDTFLINRLQANLLSNVVFQRYFRGSSVPYRYGYFRGSSVPYRYSIVPYGFLSKSSGVLSVLRRLKTLRGELRSVRQKLNALR